MPSARQLARATKQDPMGTTMRMQTYCTSNGDFEDVRLEAEFKSARARMALIKSAMLVEAPLLVNQKARHPNGGSYMQAYTKVLSKHAEMDAREAKFSAKLHFYSANIDAGINPSAVLDDDELVELRMDMVWLLIVRESYMYFGFDWRTDGPRR